MSINNISCSSYGLKHEKICRQKDFVSAATSGSQKSSSFLLFSFMLGYIIRIMLSGKEMKNNGGRKRMLGFGKFLSEKPLPI